MKRTGLLTLVLVMLFSASTFAQEVKVKENKVKVNDEKVKVKADDVKVKANDVKVKADDVKVKANDVKVKADDVKVKANDIKVANVDMNNPYKATYSSSYAMGNPVYSQMILDIWKDWDDNMLDRHDYMADSLQMFFADGSSMKGKQANLEAGKKFRGSMKAVKSTIHAWVPLKSLDRNEDMVLIWGEEENTMADGKVEKRPVHEVWWFNKDGKLSAMRQWTASPGKQ